MTIIKGAKERKETSKLHMSSLNPRSKIRGLTPDPSLFLLGELFFADVIAAKLDVEHPLHRRQNLLVWSGSAPLEVLDDGDGGVALGGEFLLGHLVRLLVAAPLDGIGNLSADGLGLDDVVAAVDLGQMLAFGGA